MNDSCVSESIVVWRFSNNPISLRRMIVLPDDADNSPRKSRAKSQSVSKPTMAEQLEILARLHRNRELTAEEFANAKERIIFGNS